MIDIFFVVLNWCQALWRGRRQDRQDRQDTCPADIDPNGVMITVWRAGPCHLLTIPSSQLESESNKF